MPIAIPLAKIFHLSRTSLVRGGVDKETLKLWGFYKPGWMGGGVTLKINEGETAVDVL